MYSLIQSNVDYLAAGSSLTPVTLLDDLANSGEYRVRARVAENSKTSEPTLQHLLYDTHREVRISLSYNEALPILMKMQLVRDEDPDVRYALAENPLLNGHMLEILSRDENPYVAHRAQTTLSQIGCIDCLFVAA